MSGVPHLTRACEILWEAGHPIVAQRLEQEVVALLDDRDRLALILYPAELPPGVCPVCTKDLESDGWCFECHKQRRGADAPRLTPREFG